MNKTLISAAIAATFLAPLGAAVADTTLYGQLHASYDILDADGPGVSSKKTVASNSSHIGVKGSAELNHGLSLIYQAEWGIDTGGADGSPLAPTHGNSTFVNRNQVVGLAGNYGAALIGRHDTPMKTVGRKADLFWSTQLGQNRSVTNPANWDLRPNNVIAYQTPKMGGFQGLGAYVTDIAGDDASSAISVNGFYNAGPLMLGAGYENHDLDGLAPGLDRDAFRLMASYKIGATKLVGFYQDEDNGFAITGVPDATVYGIGAAYTIGAGTIKGQYYARDNDGTNADPDLIAVGYDYKLGKKTDVYAQYATVSDGQTLGGAGHGETITSTNGGDSDGVSFGVRHNF